MRIYSIDLFKLIFTILVVFAHMDINYPGADVAVDFFFVMSGFFMAKKFYSRKDDESYSQFDYTADRLKKLYPQYIFSLLVMFCYILGRDVVRIAAGSHLAGGIGDLAARVYEIIPSVFMVQNIGFFGSGINGPAWYLSVMVVAGCFIYAFLRHNHRMYSETVFPIVFILLETYLYGGKDPFGIVGPFYIAMLRGVAAMLQGVLIYKFFCSSWGTKLRSGKVLFNIVGIFSIIALFACGRFNNSQLIMFVFAVVYMNTSESWINKAVKGRIFGRVGDLAYAVYLNHALVIMVLEDLYAKLGIAVEHIKFGWIAVAASVVYSIFTVWLLDRLKPFCKNKILPVLKAKKIV